MIFKKITLIALFFIMASPYVFADSLYVGAGLGVSDFADRQLITAPTAPNAAPTTHDYSGLGLLGSAIAGYRFDLKRFNFGLEGFSTLYNNKIGVDDISIVPVTSGQGIAAMKVTQRYAYGARLLPGYEIIPNVIGYAIIGVSRGVFRLRDTGANSFAQSNFGIYGPQFGLGVSMALLKNLETRLDVTYTKYPKDHYTTSGLLPNTADNHAAYYDSLSSFDSVLSLIYRFNLG